jgi:hypothetical protein
VKFPDEKKTFTILGNVMVMPLSGLLCRYGWDGGWPSIYYLLGFLGILWAFLWMFCVADSPQKHRKIKEDERNYIMDSLQDTVAKEDTVSTICLIMFYLLIFSVLQSHGNPYSRLGLSGLASLDTLQAIGEPIRWPQVCLCT